MSNVVIIGKGSSAPHLLHTIGKDDDIAVINDAYAIVPNKRINYCFFSDGFRTTTFAEHAHRIDRFISRELEDWELESIVDEVRDKWTTHIYRGCDGDFTSLKRMCLRGGIMWHHTTPGAIHWLAKYGRYKKITVIGVDGDREYAPNTDDRLTVRIDPALFRMISRRTAMIVAKVYDVKLAWYDRHTPDGEWM